MTENRLNAPNWCKSLPEWSQNVPKCPLQTHRCPNELDKFQTAGLIPRKPIGQYG